jgi:putative SOS response-associated peptidase YedK
MSNNFVNLFTAFFIFPVQNMNMKIIDDACGRYTLHAKAKELQRRYNTVKSPDEIEPNYNAAPGQTMPVAKKGEDGKFELELMRWGLVPVWAKDMRIGYKLINARDDTIFEKPMWRGVILKKRCLVPADGFYEWKKPQAGTKELKKPFYIHPKQLDVFSFAGVWSSWHDAEGKRINTYSIITTEPNKEMSSVHNRMPVILYPEEESGWLESAKTRREEIESYIHPYEDNGLDMFEVSREVNVTKNNDEKLILPLNSK